MIEYFMLGVIFNFIFVVLYIIISIILVLKLHPVEVIKLKNILTGIKENEFEDSFLKKTFRLFSIFVPFYKTYIYSIGLFFLYKYGNNAEGITYAILKTEGYAILSAYKGN